MRAVSMHLKGTANRHVNFMNRGKYDNKKGLMETSCSQGIGLNE